ncbi:OprO/OprP family phosphate-selective porin [Novosphingobium panipatense]|uniref:OprO/OprP family phosphate-selective porin n=1 Tax=Novosphingobium TaxID=165696 RepID=UPI000CDAA4CC|nr:porin [Novosphingobium sp. HII-3]
MRTIVAGAAVAATFMGFPAYAQSPAEQSSSGQPMGAQEADALRAEVRALRARLEALESRLGSAAPAQAAAAPADDTTPPDPSSPAPPLASSEEGTGAAAGGGKTAKEETAIAWKGSPNFTQGDKAFKVKGRIQADANYVSTPDSLDDQGLGFSTEMRRIRLGGEGKLSSQFSYKLELELSDNAVDLVDTFVTFKDGPWQVQLGNQNAFWSLDELTGDTTGSVMERAAFTDAFNFERRLGIGAQYGKGAWLAQLGVFADDIGALANSSDGPEGGDENNSYSIDGRLVYAPKIGDIQVHVGGSAHWRRLGRLADATTRYRQRPYAHSTNTRLIGTPEMNVSRETMYGAELAAIAGRWHGAAEFYNLTASRVGLPSVSFQGAYAEVGYFLTKGDTRGYKGGIFAGNDPARPLDEGGPGAIQVNLRYDWLDLNDRDIRGGTQNGYIVALIWSPIQYLRFNLNYALLQYTGARALPSGDRSYDANVIGTRFELDF